MTKSKKPKASKAGNTKGDKHADSPAQTDEQKQQQKEARRRKKERRRARERQTAQTVVAGDTQQAPSTATKASIPRPDAKVFLPSAAGSGTTHPRDEDSVQQQLSSAFPTHIPSSLQQGLAKKPISMFAAKPERLLPVATPPHAKRSGFLGDALLNPDFSTVDEVMHRLERLRVSLERAKIEVGLDRADEFVRRLGLQRHVADLRSIEEAFDELRTAEKRVLQVQSANISFKVEI